MSKDNSAAETSGNNKELAELKSSLRQMLDTAQQEHELKREELDVRRAQIVSNEKLGLASIEANKQYHRENYTHYNAHLIHRYWFVGGIVLLVLVFFGFAIHSGATDLVADLAKLFVGAGVGAFGGYHYGKSNRNTEQ